MDGKAMAEQKFSNNKASLWEDLAHLIYLKKRGVLLFLITVNDGSFP